MQQFIPLNIEDLNTDPLAQFEIWFDDAEKKSGQNYPNACYLSTVNQAGYPETRTVLLRGYDQLGFRFYTNLNSKKGRALQQLPKAAMVFHWDRLYRQVRLVGDVSVLSDAIADAYFAGRPRISQLGAWASDQSALLANREELEQRVAHYDRKFKDKQIPRPPHWTGFTLLPLYYEFMQEREGRLHDRFIYQRADNGWKLARLNP